jgi:hypothetical protein
MVNDKSTNQEIDQSSSNNKTENNSNTTMPRAQSNLDILSQTASVIEEVSLTTGSSTTGSSNNSCTTTAEPSPPQPARVTPAEQNCNTYYQIQKKNMYYPIDDHCQKSFLALPDISSKPTEYHHSHQPSIFLEQKRGFLPPALSFETSGGILVGGQPISMEMTSSYYSPGLYLSYSNGSNSMAVIVPAETSVSSDPVGKQRVMSPPQDHVVLQKNHVTAATVSTGSSNSSGGGGSSPTGNGDGDTVVNSFFSVPSNSFSSTGGASVSSSVIAGLPSTSPQYQFSSINSNNVPVDPLSMPAAFVPPQPPMQQRNDANVSNPNKGNIEFSDEMIRENFVLRQQLAANNVTITNLQNQVEMLQNEIRQLRQIPSGKISQIPLE